MVDLRQAELTDEMIEYVSSLEGQPLRVEPWNTEATRDGIRHFAWGIGDNNPLYCDPEYAASSVQGGIVAPPTFLCTVFTGHIGVGIPNVQPYGVGSHWELFEPVRRGDQLSVVAKIGPVTVHEGRTASRFIIQTTVNEYFREDGTLIARSSGRAARVPRARSEGGLSYEPREMYEYTQEELENIRKQAVSEPRRGAEVRTAGSVKVGDKLPAVVKGPIDITGQIAFYAGHAGSPRQKSAEMGWLYRTWAVEAPEKLPNNYDPSYYSEETPTSVGHVRADVASEMGMPGAYNNGTQTSSWLLHTVTNWMSDAGFVKEFDVRLRRPIIFNDTLWCDGVVTGVAENGEVSIDVKGTNQLGEVCATAKVVVALPLS